MILADTSVVVDALRSRDPKLYAIVVNHQAAICGVTHAEILCGARNAAHRSKLAKDLSVFGRVLLPELIWDSVGDHLARLRAAGVTIPFSDVVVATAAISNDIEVWAHDAHFSQMQAVLPTLRLFQEPP
jgi:predicted nucleic acid-binding protein